MARADDAMGMAKASRRAEKQYRKTHFLHRVPRNHFLEMQRKARTTSESTSKERDCTFCQVLQRLDANRNLCVGDLDGLSSFSRF
jgi:hypothetical protein